jgi:lipoprotein-anchoring transpeptidase ErfK/SrfK
MKQISRRDFLKLGGMALAGLAFTSFLPETTFFQDGDLIRVATDSVSVYKEPSDKSEIVQTWLRDDVIHVYDTVKVTTPGATPVWYRVFGGYMNAARLQKVQVHYNVPLKTVPDTKQLVEVTVPYIQPYQDNQYTGWTPIDYRLYYSSTHWITNVGTGPDGKAWYTVQDEADKNTYFQVPAIQMRPIAAEEFAPISPEIPFEKKRIDVNLSTQFLTCYQNEEVAFTAVISSGVPWLYPTPTGQFNIMDKLPSRRMSAATSRYADDIALAGVPWTSFFTAEGVALHGTYWHDNFGIPMSHGCVNMKTEDARWVFRWTRPTSGFDDINKSTLDVKGYGTVVNVHY